MLAFFALFSGIAMANPKVLLRCNTLFVVFLWISFVVIVIMGERYVEAPRLAYKNWKMLPAALPIIVMAANFHNIIPTVCRRLDWDFKAILMAFLFGSLIGFAMNAVWIQIGMVPADRYFQ